MKISESAAKIYCLSMKENLRLHCDNIILVCHCVILQTQSYHGHTEQWLTAEKVQGALN